MSPNSIIISFSPVVILLILFLSQMFATAWFYRRNDVVRTKIFFGSLLFTVLMAFLAWGATISVPYQVEAIRREYAQQHPTP